MPTIGSNLDEMRQHFGVLRVLKLGAEKGYSLIIVRTKEGDTSGHPHIFEVMGQKLSDQMMSLAGYNAYRIIKNKDRYLFEDKPVFVNFGPEGQWVLLL